MNPDSTSTPVPVPGRYLLAQSEQATRPLLWTVAAGRWPTITAPGETWLEDVCDAYELRDELRITSHAKTFLTVRILKHSPVKPPLHCLDKHDKELLAWVYVNADQMLKGEAAFEATAHVMYDTKRIRIDSLWDMGFWMELQGRAEDNATVD